VRVERNGKGGKSLILCLSYELRHEVLVSTMNPIKHTDGYSRWATKSDSGELPPRKIDGQGDDA
jgi:hypothetical protein